MVVKVLAVFMKFLLLQTSQPRDVHQGHVLKSLYFMANFKVEA